MHKKADLNCRVDEVNDRCRLCVSMEGPCVGVHGSGDAGCGCTWEWGTSCVRVRLWLERELIKLEFST